MQEKPYYESMEFALHKDETVLWEGTPKKSAYVIESVFRILPLVLVWAAFDTTFIAMMIKFGVFGQVSWLLYIIIPFFLLHLAPVRNGCTEYLSALRNTRTSAMSSPIAG